MINIPDIYPEEGGVNQTSYCILLKLKEDGEPLWKREVTRRINEWRRGDLCPLNIRKEVNAQTISRKLDLLEEKGLVESYPVRPDKIERYVEGYRITEKGLDRLEEISEIIIENLAVKIVEKKLRSDKLVLEEGVIDKISSNSAMKTQPEGIDELGEELGARLGSDLSSAIEVGG